MTFTVTARALETARRNGIVHTSSRIVPEEVPIAFSYGGSSHAVMMPSVRLKPTAKSSRSAGEAIITAWVEPV